MDRRAFIGTLAGGLLVAPLAAEATAQAPRIGMLSLFRPEHPQARELSDAFRQGLRELGYVGGENIIIEYRSAQGGGSSGSRTSSPSWQV